jgi:hypothetical protein
MSRNLGFVELPATIAVSSSTGPLAPVVFGVLAVGALLAKLFGAAPRGDFQKFGRTIYPQLSTHAAATGRNTYAWWFGDIVEVRPDGGFAAVAHFTSMGEADAWLVELAKRVAIEVIVCAGDYLTEGPGVCHFETWEPQEPEVMEPPSNGAPPDIPVEVAPGDVGRMTPPGDTSAYNLPRIFQTVRGIASGAYALVTRASRPPSAGGATIDLQGGDSSGFLGALSRYAPWLLLGVVILMGKRKR